MSQGAFGSRQPWSEPSWYHGRPSPYYTESHKKLRNVLRAWTTKYVQEKDVSNIEGSQLYRSFAEAGLLLPIAVGGEIPMEYSRVSLIAGIDHKSWDYFHDFILWDELYRIFDHLPSEISGLVVGFPPLQDHGSAELKAETIPAILRGEKSIAFAVTEPDAGSDIQNITTTAELSPDGSSYVVNGQKKWITNGMKADYFTPYISWCQLRLLCVLGKAGRAGLTLLLIPKTEAVGVMRMELGLDGQETTAYVTFDDVVVPVSHRIGEEGQGFLYTVANFNHERLLVAFQALSLCRVCLRETIIWAEKREAFGRKLIEQPVVRSKLANLGRTVESLQAWTEQITYEMEVAKVSGETKTLGGVSALLKVTSGRTVKYVADECQKIFGGAGMTKTGQGRLVEAITRRAPLLIIPGGAEDVMLDLGAREALKLSHL